MLAAALSLWQRPLLFIVIIMLSALNMRTQRPQRVTFGERVLTYSGVVIGEDHHEDYTKLLVQIDRLVIGKDTINCILPVEYYAFGNDIFFGKRLFIRGKTRPARYGYRPDVLTGDIIAARVEGHPFGILFRPVQKYVDDRISQLFNDEHGRIASGLIVGGSARVSGELNEVFSRAGVLHILAVSGMHVGYMAAFLGLVLFLVPVDYRFKFVIIMAGLILYAGVTGFCPSVCRATLMAFLFGIATVLQRNVDHLHIINMTAIFFLIASPLLLFDISAQLSFAAVYGIIYLYPKLEAMIRKARRRCLKLLLNSMAVSVSAQVFVAPLLIYYFHRLPTYAIFSNLLIVPLASVITFSLFACLLVGLFWFNMAQIIALPVGFSITLLVVVSRFFASVPFSAINLIISPLLLFPSYFMGWAKCRRIVVWVSIAIISFFSIAGSIDCLKVCSVAKGVLITLPSGATIFVSEQKQTAQRVFLRKNGVTELDYLVSPSEHCPVRSKHIMYPDKTTFVKLIEGDFEMSVGEKVAIKYQQLGLEYDLADGRGLSEDGTVTYLLARGARKHEVRGSLYDSILEQLILDAQLIVARLRLVL